MAKRKHRVLGSGWMVKAGKGDPHVWIPASVCHGIALCRKGKPGAVVAHRLMVHHSAPRERLKPKDMARLRRGQPVNVEGRVAHPGDLIEDMRVAARDFGDPSEMELLIMPGMAVKSGDEVLNSLHQAGLEAKEAGRIGECRIFHPKEGHVFRVQPDDGTVHHEPITRLGDKLEKTPDYIWRE